MKKARVAPRFLIPAGPGKCFAQCQYIRGHGVAKHDFRVWRQVYRLAV